MSSIHKACISLLVALNTACGVVQHNDDANLAVELTRDDNRVLWQSAGKQQVLHQAPGEIEALYVSGDHILWGQDPGAELWLGTLNEGKLDAAALGALNHDIDGLCAAPVDKGVLDIFISDGDGGLHHYWLQTADATLTSVRRLNTNPDIERCLLTEDAVVLDDPYLGPIAAQRNPENDAILRPAPPLSDRQSKQLKSDSFALDRNVVALPQHNYPVLTASLETAAVDSHGDAADDPAILVGSDNYWIAGTDKQKGLRIYDASGAQIHFLPRGRVNNVDAIQTGDDQFLLTASNRTEKTIDLYRANLATNQIEFTNAIPLNLDDPYGLCMGRAANGDPLVFVGDSEGAVQHWRLSAGKANMLQQWDFDTQTEGCVYDAGENALYVGQEELGIWRFGLGDGSRALVEAIDAGNLVADVEGLDIYRRGDQRWLVASSQGEDAYAVYAMDPWQLVGKFRIGADYQRGLDGASETDGLAVTSAPLPGYPKGILVVQDGRNRAPQANQNFKVVDWRAIEALIAPAP